MCNCNRFSPPCPHRLPRKLLASQIHRSVAEYPKQKGPQVFFPHFRIDAVRKEHPDSRYEARGYDLYDTEYWYSRVRRYAVYRSPNPKIRVKLWRIG